MPNWSHWIIAGIYTRYPVKFYLWRDHEWLVFGIGVLVKGFDVRVGGQSVFGIGCATKCGYFSGLGGGIHDFKPGDWAFGPFNAGTCVAFDIAGIACGGLGDLYVWKLIRLAYIIHTK